MPTTIFRIGRLFHSGGDLFEALYERRFRRSGGHQTASSAARDVWWLELAEMVAELWDCSRRHALWDVADALDLGVSVTSTGRCRPIPEAYRSQVLRQARATSMTPKTVGAFIEGMQREKMPAAVKCNKTKLRAKDKIKQLARIQRAAKSKLLSAHPRADQFGRRISSYGRARYLRAAKKMAKSEGRLSLTMDATSVRAHGKLLNATFWLPVAGQSQFPPCSASAQSQTYLII